MYNYDQIYPYEKILEEVKDLILPSVVEMVHPEDARSSGVRREDLANIYYSHIMALAYNDGNINACLEDLMPLRSPIIYSGSEEEDAANMFMYLCVMQEDFERQIRAFRVFHHLTKELTPPEDILMHVQLQLSMSPES